MTGILGKTITDYFNGFLSTLAENSGLLFWKGVGDVYKRQLSWLWETLVIALAVAAVCVVCAMLICKAVKKNLSKKTAAVIGAAARCV